MVIRKKNYGYVDFQVQGLMVIVSFEIMFSLLSYQMISRDGILMFARHSILKGSFIKLS